MFQLHSLLDKVLSIPECDWWLSLLTGEGVGEEPAPLGQQAERMIQMRALCNIPPVRGL